MRFCFHILPQKHMLGAPIVSCKHLIEALSVKHSKIFIGNTVRLIFFQNRFIFVKDICGKEQWVANSQNVKCMRFP